MWGRSGRWFAERWREQWRKEGAYGLIPPVVLFVALHALEGEDGDRSAWAWIVSVGLGLAAWFLVRWVRDDPTVAPEDERSS